MAIVTGLTKERMLEIEAASIVDGNVDGTGHLILVRHDGTTIDAGYIVDQTALVDLVNDQTVAGEKTFSEKVSIELPATGVGLRMGRAATLDSLNITPYGAAAVVFASGSDFDGVNSTARGASASQIEMLNAGMNWYADSGLVAGTQYARTKRMGLSATGLVLSGYNPGTTHESNRTAGSSQIIGSRGFAVSADNAVFQGGVTVGLSVAVNRAEPAVSLSNATGELIYGHNGATKTLGVSKDGGITAYGPDHKFGQGSFGGAGAFVTLTGDAAVAYVTGNLTAGNGPLYLRSQGTGELKLQANASDIVRMVNNGGLKLGFFGGAPAVKPAVTGSRGGNAALASFLTALSGLGLITDSTTA